MRRRAGLTLVELILVVLILAVLATAAAGVVESADSQLRYDQTQARATAIRNAIIGNDRTVNGQPDVAGFVADIGRLPKSETLSELLSVGWTTPNSWRGPYARPEGVGSAQFYDGYGRPFAYATAGDLGPATLTSLGADGATGGTGFDEDKVFTIGVDDCSLALPVTPGAYTVDVRSRTGAAFMGTVAIELEWTAHDVTGVVVTPNPRRTSNAVNVTLAAGEVAPASIEFPLDAGQPPRVPIGPRRLRPIVNGVPGPDRVVLIAPRASLPQLTVYAP